MKKFFKAQAVFNLSFGLLAVGVMFLMTAGDRLNNADCFVYADQRGLTKEKTYLISGETSGLSWSALNDKIELGAA